MAMHDVWCFPLHDSHEPPSQAEVEVPGAGDVVNLRSGLARSLVHLGTGRADENILHVPEAEPLQQVDDLLRAPIEVPARFDVQYFHSCLSTPPKPEASMRRADERERLPRPYADDAAIPAH